MAGPAASATARLSSNSHHGTNVQVAGYGRSVVRASWYAESCPGSACHRGQTEQEPVTERCSAPYRGRSRKPTRQLETRRTHTRPSTSAMRVSQRDAVRARSFFPSDMPCHVAIDAAACQRRHCYFHRWQGANSVQQMGNPYHWIFASITSTSRYCASTSSVGAACGKRCPHTKAVGYDGVTVCD